MASKNPKLTLEEKMRLLIGSNLWQTYDANGKLSSVYVTDSSNGVSSFCADETKYIGTSFPTLSMLCSSWDRDLAKKEGIVIADDCIEKGADVVLGPSINIKRTPLCGRNFEYCSEDPFLTGEIAKSYVEGMQNKGVGVSVKHYCANNREYDRSFMSSEVDERTLREIYLAAFENVVQANPWTIMCSYNLINGVYASENRWLLHDILRTEFNFKGTILSDWHATHNAFRALKATLDVSMPYRKDHYECLKNAYDSGLISEQEIDERVESVLNLIEKKEEADQIKKIEYSKQQRHNIAADIARECIVLLKNEENILPIHDKNVIVSGCFAYKPPYSGGGSGEANTDFVSENIADLLNKSDSGIKAEFVGQGLFAPKWIDYGNGVYRAAYSADLTVLCLGTDCSIEAEGYDRETLRLPIAQEDLILNVASSNSNVVVVLFSGSAVDMSPWIDKVKAVVYAGFCGEGVNEALSDILTGKVNPSGKLAETFPMSLDDTPTKDERGCGNGFIDKYKEGVLVGYRWYDTKFKNVLFPFGHGLSYSKITYSDLKIIKETETDYKISFMIKNESDRETKEITQLYVRDVFSMVERPYKELKGFEKVVLKPYESKQVEMSLNYRSFAYYSIPQHRWYVENGDFEILVGASSRDIRLTDKIKIELPIGEQCSQK